MSTAGMGPPSLGPGTPPPTYMVQAILTTIFCCMPFGVVAIVFASQVTSKFATRDIAGAKAASDSARKWCWVSFWVQFAAVVFYLIAVGAFLAAGSINQAAP